MDQWVAGGGAYSQLLQGSNKRGLGVVAVE